MKKRVFITVCLLVFLSFALYFWEKGENERRIVIVEKKGFMVINNFQKGKRYYKDFNPIKLKGLNEISEENLTYPYISIEKRNENIEVFYYWNAKFYSKSVFLSENGIYKEVVFQKEGKYNIVFTSYYLDSLVIRYRNKENTYDSSQSYLSSFSIKRWNNVNDANKGYNEITYIYGIGEYKIKPTVNYKSIPKISNNLDIERVSVITNEDSIFKKVIREKITPSPFEIIYNREEKDKLDKISLFWWVMYGSASTQFSDW